MTISYTDSVGNTNSYTSYGSLSIPFSATGLRANETYTISVYASVNLQDGNATVDNCFIGSVVLKTNETVPFIAELDKAENDVLNAFAVRAKLNNNNIADNTLEAQTLTGLIVNLYAGTSTSGKLVESVKKVDRNLEPYVSDLKEVYYDQSFTITPSFFGISDSELTESFYTIEIVNGYDYTKYKNVIEVENNTITVQKVGHIPQITDPDRAIETKVVRNRNAGDDYKTYLDVDTIVGYQIKANYDNSNLYLRTIKYYIRDEKTDEIIDTITVDIDATGVIDYTYVPLNDGTDSSVVDTTFTRGNSYYFTYEAFLDLNDDGIAETIYPQIVNPAIILRSSDIYPKKQEATITMYPSESNNSAFIWKYNYTDVDHSLVGNSLIYKLNNAKLGEIVLNPTTANEFNVASFPITTSGYLGIYVNEQLNKGEDPEERKIVYQLYDGKFNMINLSYHVKLETNHVVISLNDYINNLEYINKIAALRIKFTSGLESKTIDYVELTGDYAIIDLADISSLINKDIVVTVDAYYDSGMTGYDLTGPNFAFQRIVNNESDGKYYIINNSNNIIPATAANGSFYQASLNRNVLTLNNLTKNRSKELTLELNEGGYVYNYDYVQLKKLETIDLADDDSNNIRFDMIVPGVSLLDETSNLDITQSLTDASINIKLYGMSASNIENNNIFIELYSITEGESSTNNILLKTITKTISELGNTLVIDGLVPNTNYFIKIYANVYNGSTYVRQQLYDIDFQNSSKNYYFSTLNTVGITNEIINYSSTSFSDKKLILTYNLDRIIGYDRIDYEVYELDEASVWKLMDVSISSNLSFTENMTKTIDCTEDVFVSNHDYKVIIKPISIITVNGVSKEVTLETKEVLYTMRSLKKPYISVSTELNYDDLSINFIVKVHDFDNVMIGDNYFINMYDENNINITPASYLNTMYSKSSYGYIFKLSNLVYDKTYKIVVGYSMNLYNDSTHNEESSFTKNAPKFNESGITIGDIFVSTGLPNLNKLNLAFYDSYQLTGIDTVRYSIYHATSGFSVDAEISFIPTLVQNEDGTYYYNFTLPSTISNNGLYYVQIQFIKDGVVIDEKSLEYNYVTN